MEQWEKEYIDAVTKSRRAKEQGKAVDCSYEEGYDSSKWIEMKQSDGTKYYVPKETAFEQSKESKKKASYKSVRKPGKQTIKVIIRIAVAAAIVLCMFLENGSKQTNLTSLQKGSRPMSLQGFIQGQVLGGTYVNGYGFKDMMQFFAAMQTERYTFLQDVALNIDSLSAVDEETWEQIFDDREVLLEQLKYDDSYANYVEAQKQVFEEQKELLIAIKHGATRDTVLQLYNDFAGAELSLQSTIIAAMDKNGIDYSLDENGLTYWYKNY